MLANCLFSEHLVVTDTTVLANCLLSYSLSVNDIIRLATVTVSFQIVLLLLILQDLLYISSVTI